MEKKDLTTGTIVKHITTEKVYIVCDQESTEFIGAEEIITFRTYLYSPLDWMLAGSGGEAEGQIITASETEDIDSSVAFHVTPEELAIIGVHKDYRDDDELKVLQRIIKRHQVKVYYFEDQLVILEPYTSSQDQLCPCYIHAIDIDGGEIFPQVRYDELFQDFHEILSALNVGTLQELEAKEIAAKKALDIIDGEI